MLSLVCVILILTSVCSYSFRIGIKARILDPGGRDTSFLYDGGSVQISCWYIKDDGGTTLQLVAHNWKEGNYKYFNSSNRKLQHNVSINPRLLSTWYKCKDDRMRYSGTIRIKYVLCNPMAVNPRKVCPEKGEFCHVKNKGLAECNSLKKSRCLLGHSSDIISDYRKDTQLLPKFNVVCGVRKTTKLGLCHSLAYSPDKTVRFVTTDTSKRCNLDFQLYICGKDCRSKKNLTMMTGWDPVDVAKSFSIYVQVKSETTPNSAGLCDIAYTKNKEIISKKVTFDVGNKKSHNSISKQLKQLPTPAIADIVCDVIHHNEPFLRYQTSLLVFRSNKDFHYKVKEWVELDGDKKTYKFIVNVTAADGLLVCAEKGKGCTPTETTTMKTVVRKVEFKQGETDFGAFYIGLFASSPKRKYVRIHEEIRNLTTRKPGAENNTTRGASTTLRPDTRIHTTGGGRTTRKPDTTYHTTEGGRTTRKPNTKYGTTDGGRTTRKLNTKYDTTDGGRTTRKPDTGNSATSSGMSTHMPGTKSSTIGNGRTTLKPDTSTNITGGGRELQSKKSLSGIGWIIGFAVASVIATIAVVAAITIAIVCARQKKGKQRRHQGNESGASPPKPLTKSPLKDVKTIPSLDSVGVTSSKELVTASFLNIPLKSPSKETENTQTYYSQTEPYTSEISTMNAYESIYQKAHH